MYGTVIWLSLAKSRWGYFLGISVAAFWNYTNLFVTTFFRNGLASVETLIATGKLTRPDQMIAFFAVMLHFALIAACVWAYLRLPKKSAGDLLRLAFVAAASTAYFAADIALCQPRYLPLFPHLLHPHSLF